MRLNPETNKKVHSVQGETDPQTKTRLIQKHKTKVSQDEGQTEKEKHYIPNDYVLFSQLKHRNRRNPFESLLQSEHCIICHFLSVIVCIFAQVRIFVVFTYVFVVVLLKIFRIKPPMCITKEDADFFLAVFNKSVHNYMEKR